MRTGHQVGDELPPSKEKQRSSSCNFLPESVDNTYRGLFSAGSIEKIEHLLNV